MCAKINNLLYRNNKSIGSRFRSKRIAPLIKLIQNIYDTKGRVSIIDVGGKIGYWKIVDQKFLKDCNVHITILNIPDENDDTDTDIFVHKTGNACNMPEYKENEFDILHSNSVIEHVGNWENIKQFSAETKRVAKSLYIQTPNFWFPIEPHYMTPFFHWLPRFTRIWLIQKRTLGSRGKANSLDDALEKLEDQPRMLNYSCFRLLYGDCTIFKEKFLFLNKSFIAIKPNI